MSDHVCIFILCLQFVTMQISAIYHFIPFTQVQRAVHHKKQGSPILEVTDVCSVQPQPVTDLSLIANPRGSHGYKDK